MPFPVDEKFISNAEVELGVKFPAAFREKMELNNSSDNYLEKRRPRVCAVKQTLTQR